MTNTADCGATDVLNFRVDLGGVIALLSRNLYSGPGVYVRELIQNAMDAIVARDALGGDPAPRTVTISPYGVASPDSSADEFTIEDSGVGISLDQVGQFLATVGASSKRDELERDRRTYIGQFGIGLLSCFVVADRITVVSRSADGASPIEWVGGSDGTYKVRTLDEDRPVGTTVRLRPLPAMAGWVRAEQVAPLAQKYAEFLPLAVRILTAEGPEMISTIYPWALGFESHRAGVRQGVSPVYGGLGVGKQFDVIEVSDTSLGLEGVIYVGMPSTRTTSSGHNRVYINDMLVTDTDGSLLPSWAFFGWAVVNSTTLEPTASRESVKDDTALALTRERLGQALLRWLRALADTDPERFAGFVALNHMELRRAATLGAGPDSLQLAEVILPMLTMETTDGPMRLLDVVARNPRILYSPHTDEFRTIAGFAPRGRLILDAGHTLDQEVLQTLPQVIPGVTVTRVYPASEVAALVSPAMDEAGEVHQLEQRAAQALADQKCDVAARLFPSADRPSIFITRGLLDLVSPGYGRSAHLVVNWNNRVVRALARLDDQVVFNRVIQLIYVQARMASGCDTTEDRALLSAALDDLILVAVGITEIGESDG